MPSQSHSPFKLPLQAVPFDDGFIRDSEGEIIFQGNYQGSAHK